MKKRIKDYLRPQWLRRMGKRLRVGAKTRYLTLKHGLAPQTHNPLASCKTSDTLFILGNGASILQFTPDMWAEVASHDSLGINYWMLHDFVPSAYMTELPKFDIDKECLLHNLRLRHTDYAATPIFLKDVEKFSRRTSDHFLADYPAGLKHRTQLLFDIEIEDETVSGFQTQLALLDRQGVFASDANTPLPRKRASIFLAAVMAVRAGYKKIVFCGVDLNNVDYFYHAIEQDLIARGFHPLPNLQPTTIHKTNDPTFGSLTISKILDLFDQIILQPRGIELSVALKSSALYPRFPSHFEK